MALPSVLLHDHLDGGLRPETVLDLAAQSGYDRLPVGNREDLARWFDQSRSGSLEGYLSAFEHTIAVMQSRDALTRVGYEAGLDLAASGVVYVESRFCPALHTEQGLTPDEVVEAVAAGFALASVDTGLRWALIIDALRHRTDANEMVEAALRTRELGVVGFDLAGPEYAHPPADHLAAFRKARESGLRLTIHAGEAGQERGVEYMASAMDTCGAERIGHGIEIIDDCVVRGGEIVEMGPVAQRVCDRQIALEVCPASNLATKAITAAEHPFGMLYRAGLNVTLNTDNRLMSNTSMPAELEFARRHHGLDAEDLARVTRAALEAAFCGLGDKVEIWEKTIAPRFIEAGVQVEGRWE